MSQFYVCTHCSHFTSCSLCESNKGKIPINICPPINMSSFPSISKSKSGCNSCHKNYSSSLGELKRIIKKQKSEIGFLKQRAPVELPCETSDVTVDILVKAGCGRILSDKSPIFRKMLETNAGNQDWYHGIRDTTLPVLRALIDFCYTADIAFTEDVPPEEMLRVADKYDIKYLREACGEELIKGLTTENMPRMLNIAHRFDVECLRVATSKLLKENFDSKFPAVVSALVENQI